MKLRTVMPLSTNTPLFPQQNESTTHVLIKNKLKLSNWNKFKSTAFQLSYVWHDLIPGLSHMILHGLVAGLP